jgi:uncharacterized protein
VIDLVRRQLISAAVSPPILQEYQAVLSRRKFRLSAQRLDEFLFPFRNFATAFNPRGQLAVSPDESDNRFLECAEAANADFLVTGNLRHFPERHGVTRIVDARTFLNVLTLHP